MVCLRTKWHSASLKRYCHHRFLPGVYLSQEQDLGLPLFYDDRNDLGRSGAGRWFAKHPCHASSISVQFRPRPAPPAPAPATPSPAIGETPAYAPPRLSVVAQPVGFRFCAVLLPAPWSQSQRMSLRPQVRPLGLRSTNNGLRSLLVLNRSQVNVTVWSQPGSHSGCICQGSHG